MPYFTSVPGTIGLLWPGSYDERLGRRSAPVISWWKEGIRYDLTTGKLDFKGNGLKALIELEKIADSFSGATRVPAPGERISVPPSYVDFKTAEKATGFKFRVPRYTAGGTLTGVSKSLNDRFASYGYSNELGISVDKSGNSRYRIISYGSYEEALAAYQKGSLEIDQAGLEAVPVDIAGNKGLLIVRKDRHIQTPPDYTGLPTQVLPGLLWWEGKTVYGLDINDEKAFTPDIETGIQEMLKIARSMYE